MGRLWRPGYLDDQSGQLSSVRLESSRRLAEPRGHAPSHLRRILPGTSRHPDDRLGLRPLMRYPRTWLQPGWLVARRVKRLLTRLRQSAVVLHLGAGGKRVPGAINCDLYDPGADRQWDATRLTEVPSGSVDVIEHHHLIEHLSAADLTLALAEWARVLKIGGLLVVSAPDLERVLERWLAMSELERWDYGIKMIYGSQEHEGLFHKNGFTPGRLAAVLNSAGFVVEWSYRGFPRRPTPSFILIARNSHEAESKP
jgi:SAM-dependent methyltransferase